MSELDVLVSDFLSHIQEQVLSKDMEKIKFAAHAIKGASSGLTYNDLADIFAKIEVACDEDDFDALGELIKNVEAIALQIRNLKHKKVGAESSFVD